MYPLPEYELERISALHAACVLDSGPAPEFDAVVALVRDILNVPICLVSLVDTNRQWFKAKCGIEIDGSSRDVAFCNYALLSDEVLVIEDARSDVRFMNNPLVTGAPHVCFYAGAPLLLRPGVALGTLCVIGTEARSMSQGEVQILRRLAEVVMGLIRGHTLAHDAALLVREAEAQATTVQKQARELAFRERRFLQTERIARVGGWELDLSTNSVGWSDETYRIYEIPIGTHIDFALALSAYPPKERARLAAIIDRTLEEGTGYDEEFELETTSGTWKWVRAVGEVELENGIPKRLFGTFQDVSERHRTEERLWLAANRDSLTGLANRNRFDEMLGSGHTASSVIAGMLMVDADHLKEVNDTLGHNAGDELIRAIASRLRDVVGSIGTVARVGGDEFAVVILVPTDAEALERLAEAILKAMQPWTLFKGQALRPGVSIGGALRGSHVDAETLHQSADLALYQAKATRRGGYLLFHDGFRSSITARTVAVNLVDDALTAGDVFAYYQPVIELETGRVSAFEALARVRVGKTVVSIGDFAEALHDRRTATRLTACMLKRIEADIVAWRAAGATVPRIGFNVGALDFQDGAIESMILATCERAGIAPSQLAMEVTESVFLSRGANIVSETAARLRARGIIVALDDFGTGHASLAHLGTFPVDVIKMDRSFVMRMADQGPGAVIAAALIDLAHKLDIQVVAEGVEHEAQLDQLTALGCEKAQGFLFSRALAPTEVVPFLAVFQPQPRLFRNDPPIETHALGRLRRVPG